MNKGRCLLVFVEDLEAFETGRQRSTDNASVDRPKIVGRNFISRIRPLTH